MTNTREEYHVMIIDHKNKWFFDRFTKTDVDYPNSPDHLPHYLAGVNRRAPAHGHVNQVAHLKKHSMNVRQYVIGTVVVSHKKTHLDENAIRARKIVRETFVQLGYQLITG